MKNITYWLRKFVWVLPFAVPVVMVTIVADCPIISKEFVSGWLRFSLGIGFFAFLIAWAMEASENSQE